MYRWPVSTSKILTYCACVIAVNSNELATTVIRIKRDIDVVPAIRWGGTITLNDDSQAIRCQECACVSWGQRKTDVQEDLQSPSGSNFDQYFSVWTMVQPFHFGAYNQAVTCQAAILELPDVTSSSVLNNEKQFSGRIISHIVMRESDKKATYSMRFFLSLKVDKSHY